MSPKAPLYSSPPLRPESAHAAAVSSVLQRGRAARSNPQFTPTPVRQKGGARGTSNLEHGSGTVHLACYPIAHPSFFRLTVST